MGRGGRVSRGAAEQAAAGDPLLAPWLAPLDTLAGVGPALARRLARVLGVESPRVRDLLFHLPRDVRTLAPQQAFGPEDVGRELLVEVEVRRHRPGRGRSPWRIETVTAAGRLDLVFFRARRPLLERSFPPGRRCFVLGRLVRFQGHFEMHHPRPATAEAAAGRLVVWPLSGEVGAGRFRRAVEAALAAVPDLPEWHPPALLARLALPTFREALARLHRGDEPPEPDSPARRRLALDELLALQLALALVRTARTREPAPVLAPPGRLLAQLLAQLPFTPTDAQLRALAEIRADLARPRPMMRLVQGDVGSGKTLVALMAMLLAAEAGFQAVLMAPTEVLARQHAAALGEWLAPLGMEVGLLSGHLTAGTRRRILERLARGELRLCVGTHALFQPDVTFHRLGLVVVDEQHRFGVAQRAALVAKGPGAHLLLLSATPIPRTQLLCWYGDLAISRLHEMPPGRAPRTTRVVPLTRLGEVIEAIARALARGEQGYWICPAIAPAEAAEIAAAEARFAALCERFGEVVGLVHGGQPVRERMRVMRAFAEGVVRLLVATTVVEVGVDVPAARFMVIEQAERFGLAQLHQLRGRVGRGDRPGVCLLLYTPPLAPPARRRLALLRGCDDGFRLAEKDLRLRGPGEILGVRQSGMPQLRFADLTHHRELLALAAREARAAVAAGPLDRSRRRLLELFGHQGALGLLRAG